MLTLLGADPLEQAKALIALADAFLEDSQYEEARLRAQRARELAAGDRELAVAALGRLASAQMTLGMNDSASTSVESIDRLLKGGQGASGLGRVWLTWLRGRLLVARCASAA